MIRALTLTALALTAPLATGCGLDVDCSDVGYADQTRLVFDDHARADERWRVELTADGAPLCTVVADVDGADEDDCRAALSGVEWTVTADGATVMTVYGALPDGVELRLAIDDVVVSDAAYAVRYDDVYAEGRVCGPTHQIGEVTIEVVRPRP